MLALSSFTALLSSTPSSRLVTLATSPAMRLACWVSSPMSGSVAPGHASPPGARACSSAALSSGSSCCSARPRMLARHSPKRLDEAATTAGSGGRSAVRSNCMSTCTHSSAARRMAVTRPTFTPRSVTGAPGLSPPTSRKRALFTTWSRDRLVCESQSAPAATAMTAATTVTPTTNSRRRFTSPPRRVAAGPR